MILWALLLVMITVINVTMVAAVMQLFGSIPDKAFMKILSRYLRKKSEPKQIPLSPSDVAARLGGLHRRILHICLALIVAAIALSIWTLAVGWGAVGMTAGALWVAAGNIFFSSIAPANWRRRSLRIKPTVYVDDDENEPSKKDQE
jgi:hypothetical protein